MIKYLGLLLYNYFLDNVPKVATPEDVRRAENTSPWGKPGAGAPLKDDKGNIVKNTKGRIKQEAQGII